MDPFLRKLRHGARLTAGDEQRLAGLARPERRLDPGAEFATEGAETRSLFVVLEGWAARFKLLENGKRQIVSFLLPGDLGEPFGAPPRLMDSSVGAITAVVIAEVPQQAIRAAARESPRLERALWHDLLRAAAAEREHIVSLGRRSAAERLGHVLCELHLRLSAVGLVRDDAFELPVTQADLADHTGMSAVHVNRSLRELRETGLISLENRRLAIHDLDGLRDASLFDPSYLQIVGDA